MSDSPTSQTTVIGRRPLLDVIWHMLRDANLILDGARRIGKTTLLEEMVRNPRPGFIAVRIDLEGIEGLSETPACFRRALDRANLAVPEELEAFARISNRVELETPIGSVKTGGESDGPWDRIRQYIEAAMRKDKIIVLCLDEVPWWLDRLEREQAGQAAVALGRLRQLRQRQDLRDRLRMILTGSVRTDAAATLYGASGSIGQMERKRVAPLSKDAGRALLEVQLLERVVTPQGLSYAHELCGGSPYWLRTIAARLAVREGAIDEHAIDAVADQLLTRERFADEGPMHMEKRYGPARGAQLSAVMSAVAITGRVTTADAGRLLSDARGDVRDVLNILVDDFVLKRDGDGYVVFNPLFARWWREHISP